MASGITNAIGKSKLQEKDVTITQNGTSQVAPDSGYDGISKATIITNVPSTPTEEKTVDLSMASGNQVITPTSGKVLSKVTITKPSTMLATNIKKDVNIGGVVGTYEGVILPTYNGLLRFASAPTISLANSTLNITAVDNATSYAIYSNNTLLTTITTTSVDLSTLITTAGSYTIYAIAKATGYVDSEKSNEVSYIKIDNWKCTVANLGSENPTSVTFTHEGTMPTFEEITFNSDIFIKIPTMYRKVNTVVDNQITSYTISNNKTDDEYKPYPCFLKEDGITIMPYILIGKYFSSSSTTCNSIQTYATSNYSENGRANAVAKGEGYQLYDWMMHKLWQDLITCKMNNININSGTGIDIDSLGLYWSSYEAYIDGISHFPAFVAFSYKPTAYIDNPRWNSPNYNSDIYAISQNSGVIKNLGYNSDHPFVNYPTSVEKSSENIYYCDVYTSSTDTSPIISTIGGKSKNYGAFFVNAASGWRVNHYIRLCYRPINE